MSTENTDARERYKSSLKMPKNSGIILLNEGVHQFFLENGTWLRVYASPSTGSKTGDGAFQDNTNEGHNYAINSQDSLDVVITHGPPKGILDRTEDGNRTGCLDLLTAVSKDRPLMHCFGHIHEGWGAKLATWSASHQLPKHLRILPSLTTASPP